MAKNAEDWDMDRRGFPECMAWVGTGAFTGTGSATEAARATAARRKAGALRRPLLGLAAGFIGSTDLKFCRTLRMCHTAVNRCCGIA